MTRWAMRSTLAATLLGLAAEITGVVFAEDAAQAKSEPERFVGIAMVTNAPSTGMVRFRVTVDRWSTDEERTALAQALHNGGTEALVAAMEKNRVGSIQFDNNLGWPLRVASSWQTEKGRLIRLGTNRPIYTEELRRGTRSLDYPIGIIEFTLPPEGPGEGTLLAATRAAFDSQGRLEVKSLPQNAGPQLLHEIEREVPKPKKKKENR